MNTLQGSISPCADFFPDDWFLILSFLMCCTGVTV